MRIPTAVAVILALTTLSPQLVAAQGDRDAESVRSYQDYWRQIQTELRLAGNDCQVIAGRLRDWVERNREDIDSLLAQSDGLMDRLTESQINALLPSQEPLLFQVAQTSARCIGVPEFREAITAVAAVIGMGY